MTNFKHIDIEYLRELLIEAGYLYQNDDGDWFIDTNLLP